MGAETVPAPGPVSVVDGTPTRNSRSGPLSMTRKSDWAAGALMSSDVVIAE
jgi:hypothetical protein